MHLSSMSVLCPGWIVPEVPAQLATRPVYFYAIDWQHLGLIFCSLVAWLQRLRNGTVAQRQMLDILTNQIDMSDSTLGIGVGEEKKQTKKGPFFTTNTSAQRRLMVAISCE